MCRRKVFGCIQHTSQSISPYWTVIRYYDIELIKLFTIKIEKNEFYEHKHNPQFYV